MSLNVDFTVNPNAKKRQIMGAQESTPQVLSNALTTNASKGGQFLAGGGNVYNNQSNAGLGTQSGMQNGTTPGVIGPPVQQNNWASSAGNSGLIANSGWGGAQPTGTISYNPNAGTVPNVGSNGIMAVNYGGNTYRNPSTTPGGLQGDINENRYGGPGQPVNPRQGVSARTRAQVNQQRWDNGEAGNANASQWLSDFGPVDTGVDNFRQFGDQYYQHIMDRTAGQREQQANALRQRLINSGIREGSDAFNAEMSRLDQANNDFLSGAAVQAEQLGLGAQNQFFNQSMQNNQFGLAQNNQNYMHGYNYDALNNALNQARIGAAATTGAASIGANASMYGQDQQNYRAELAHMLGLGQLSEGARQFDINDIRGTQQMDQNYNLGLLDRYNNFMNTDLQSQALQQAMNRDWWNMGSGITQMAPGSNFTGVNVVGPMQQAGVQQANAQAAQNQGIASLLMGGLSLIPGLSDRRVKTDVEHVGTVDGVNVYEFNYIDAVGSPGRYRGVMADEVRKSHPEAVSTVNGFDSVDYSMLPVDMVRL